jgi:hypothetical protein
MYEILSYCVELRQRELDRERQKREWEMKERQAEEQRLADEERMRRQQEEMQLRMHHQEEEMRRRQQENTLFMQVGPTSLYGLISPNVEFLPVTSGIDLCILRSFVSTA